MKHFTFQEHSLFVLLSNTRIRSLYFIPKLKKYICEQSCRCSLLPYIGLCVCSYTSMLEGGIKFTGMSILLYPYSWPLSVVIVESIPMTLMPYLGRYVWAGLQEAMNISLWLWFSDLSGLGRLTCWINVLHEYKPKTSKQCLLLFTISILFSFSTSKECIFDWILHKRKW